PPGVLKQGQQPPLAIAPFDEAQAKQHQRAWAEYRGVAVETTNSVGMKLVLIPAGEFMMRSPAKSNEGPQHRVEITKPFYLGVTEVTQEQYEQVMGENPSKSKVDPQCPVESVSWGNAEKFCERLSEKEGKKYRLPTEAQWEYACRAGSPTKWYFGDSESQLGEYAWYRDNSGRTTHPVGQKKPNGWRLYDMHGNVWEWCADWKADYANSSSSDPTGPSSGSYRVGRGGGWDPPARACHSALRYFYPPGSERRYLGFRVSLVPAE
ncbi:MAG: formylglycine-generating enzyme family protein, partial [Planctomycetes bacterium]|nr:formylglycine-generating enzyme family protein [Planctomycetota bacterium]